MTVEEEAVNKLEELGLTQYEAQCFVALSRISQGTAKEISTVADVPRSRVYDTVERLHTKGLIDIQQSDPRQYRAVSTEQAFNTLFDEYKSSLSDAKDAMKQIESAETQEDTGVWAIASREHVGQRAKNIINEAEDDIYLLVADNQILKEEVLDALEKAVNRGVAVTVEVPSKEEQDRVGESVPSAQVRIAEGLRETEQVVRKWPGQLLLVDGQAVLASGVENGELPDVVKETAVWSHGKDHGFATWIRELVADRRNNQQ